MDLNNLSLEEIARGLELKYFAEYNEIFQKNRVRSIVWESFSKIQDINSKEILNAVKCKMCQLLLHYKKNTGTSNLIKHRESCRKKKYNFQF